MIRHTCTVTLKKEEIGRVVFITRQREGFVKGEPLFISEDEQFENDVYESLDFLPFHLLAHEGEDPREFLSNYYHAIDLYCSDTGMEFEWDNEFEVYRPELYDDVDTSDEGEIIVS